MAQVPTTEQSKTHMPRGECQIFSRTQKNYQIQQQFGRNEENLAVFAIRYLNGHFWNKKSSYYCSVLFIYLLCDTLLYFPNLESEKVRRKHFLSNESTINALFS